MAYLARIEPHTAEPVMLRPIPANDLARSDFSQLEWLVIRLARGDELSSLREPGQIGRFINWLMGRGGSPELANERLEALRKIAVLSWHFGFTVPSEDVSDFLSAGFTADQYELLVMSISAAIRSPAQRISQ
jgi:hypothetical protein